MAGPVSYIERRRRRVYLEQHALTAQRPTHGHGMGAYGCPAIGRRRHDLQLAVVVHVVFIDHRNGHYFLEQYVLAQRVFAFTRPDVDPHHIVQVQDNLIRVIQFPARRLLPRPIALLGVHAVAQRQRIIPIGLGRCGNAAVVQGIL